MQKIAVLLFVLAVVVVPWSAKDVFPSTTASRFRDPLLSCFEFRVYDPNGRELPPRWFELQRNYAGIPVGEGAGRVPTASLNPLGRAGSAAPVMPSVEEVQQWVGDRFESAWKYTGESGPAWSHVRVVVQVHQPVGSSVGTDSWQVVVFRAYPKRGLTLWRRVALHNLFMRLAGEGQTPFGIGS